MYRSSSSNIGSGIRMMASQSNQARASPPAAPGSGGVKRMALADFEKLVTIAKGSFGVVYKAVRKDNGRVYALKQVEIANMNRAEREEAVDEARVLAGMDSKFVIKYYDCFLEDGKLNIVMQFAPNGTLHSRLHAQRGKALPEEKVWKFFIQALLGLRHVHSKKIIHRDMKSLNLFFDAEDNVLVGDLGIAKVLSPNTMFARTIVGTPYYLSPELCEDKPYNEKSDVWALGVVLYEMCTGGKHPFDAQNEGALIRKIMKGVYAPLPAGKFSSQLSDVLKLCLTMDHRQRPDTAALLANTAIGSRARSLGIELDPDAKNVSHRPSVASARPAEPPFEAIAADGKARRPPLAEVAPPDAPPSWELPANPHLRRQIESASASRVGQSQRVHRPGPPPAGYAGADDDASYPAYEGDEPQPPLAQEPPVAAAAPYEASARSVHRSTRGSVIAPVDPAEASRAASVRSRATEPAPAPPPPRAMNALQREAAARREAMDAARANGRGGGAAKEAFLDANATDPFIAHQLAKLGVDEEKYQEAMRAAAEERAAALNAAKEHGRGGQLVGVMDGYGGEESFKGRRMGDFYDEDYGEYYPQAPAAGAPLPAPAEPAPAPARERPAPRPKPFEVDDHNAMSNYRTAAMEQSAALRDAKYEPPSFGRRRATDLMITGPSMRGTGQRPAGGSGTGGARVTANMGYAPSMVGSECTTTVAPTSYYNA